MNAMTPTLYTIGHSNLTIKQFLAVLCDVGIKTLVDVRTSPYSGFAPHFNRESLATAMPLAGIDYRFAGETLGGRPSDPTCYRHGEIPPSKADYLQLVDYHEVARRDWYRRGEARLLDLASDGPTAIMCSEEDPERCHRHHLIARHLTERAEVRHVRTKGTETWRIEEATFAPTQPALL